MLLWLIITILFCLIVARDILIPIALSVLLGFMLYPVAEFLEKKGVPRILANLMVILLAGAVLFGVIFLMAKLIGSFMSDVPGMKEKVEENLSEFQQTINDWIGVTEEKQDEMLSKQSDAIYDSVSNFGKMVFSATATTVFKFFLLPVYVFLVLFYRDKFRIFLHQMIADRSRHTVENMITEISHVATKYLSGMTFVVVILSFINSTGLYLIGIKHAILFGLIAAIFNFIPYLGTIIGYLVVLVFALATQDINIAMRIIPFFFIVQFVENNILTPNIAGSQVKINPMVAIVSLIISGTIWGLAGMFVVIPYLAMLLIVFKHIPTLQPLAFLMSTTGTEHHSISWEGIKSKFKRWFGKNDQ